MGLKGGLDALDHVFEIRTKINQKLNIYFVLNETADNLRSVFFWNCTQPRVAILNFLTLEGGTDRFPETSARNYHFTLRNIPEERRSHLTS